MQRKKFGLFVASFLTSLSSGVIASELGDPVASSGVVARANAQLVDPLSIVYPPGSNFHFRSDLGFLVFDPATFAVTNLLAAPTSFGAATVFPVSVSETNGTMGRERLWSAGSAVVWTSQPPAGYNTTSAVTSVFGACPAWENLESYVADRDPWRQTVTLTLVGTDNVDAVETVLSNALAAVQGGGTTNLPWTTNDLAFISIKPAADGSSGYVYIPVDVPLFDLFGTTNLIAEPLGGWNLLGQQNRSGNPMAFALGGVDLALLALGRMDDTDGDGLTDAREALLTGTSVTNVDTDADGLTDGEEFLQYRTNPQHADTDGDGLFDGWEASSGLSPLVWHNANAVDSDTLTPAQRQQLGIGTGHVEVVDLAASNVVIEYRSVSAARSKTEGFADFESGTNYYLHLSSTIGGGSSNGPAGSCELSFMNDAWDGAASVYLDRASLLHTGTAWQVCARDKYSLELCQYELHEVYSNRWTDGLLRTSLKGHQTVYEPYSFDDTSDWSADFSEVDWPGALPAEAVVVSPVHRYGPNTLYIWSAHPILFWSQADFDDQLEQLFDTTTLIDYTRGLRTHALAMTNVAWGTNAHAGCAHIPADLQARTNAAVSMLYSNDICFFERELNYRIGVTNSIAGVVYRATVAHVFTEADANATGVVVSITNLLALANGDSLIQTSVDGIVIPPPTNNGIIFVTILHPDIAVDSDNDDFVTHSDDIIEADAPGIVILADKDAYWRDGSMITTGRPVYLASTWTNNAVPAGMFASLEWIADEEASTPIDVFTDATCSAALPTSPTDPNGRPFGKGHVYEAGETMPAVVYVRPSMAWWTSPYEAASSHRLHLVFRNRTFEEVVRDTACVFPCNTPAMCPASNTVAIWQESSTAFQGDLDFQPIKLALEPSFGSAVHSNPYRFVIYTEARGNLTPANFQELRESAILALSVHGRPGVSTIVRFTNMAAADAWASVFNTPLVRAGPWGDAGEFAVRIQSSFFEQNWKALRTARRSLFFGVSCHGAESNGMAGLASVQEAMGGAFSCGVIGTADAGDFNIFHEVLLRMRLGAWRTAAGGFSGMMQNHPALSSRYGTSGSGKVTLWPGFIRDRTGEVSTSPLKWHPRGAVLALFDTVLSPEVSPIAVLSGDTHFDLSTPTWWNGNAALRWIYDADASMTQRTRLRVLSNKCFTPYTGVRFGGKQLAGDGSNCGSDCEWEY